ncbi:MAG: hypothetical protein KGD63_12705 [Candidatus Lokiarchaeota archaeon]|nr:hypothetical protein [Candidatus Lokiarchaeota archaeon]
MFNKNIFYHILIGNYKKKVISINNNILSQKQVSHFLNNICKNFPNFAAGVITDYDGFPIISKITEKFPYKEQELALEAITKNRTFINSSEYIKIIRNLDKDDSIKLLILLNKPNQNIDGYKTLKSTIKRQILF